jgi:hypothetical protein
MKPRAPARREWGYSRGPEYRDDGDQLPESPRVAPVEPGQIDAPGPAVAAAEGVEPAPAGDWGSPHASAAGCRSGNAALSDADAELVRRLRADGVPRADVARQMGVSVATITRITRGETYGPVVAGDDQVVIPELPAIAAAEAPPPAAWTDRRRLTDRRPPPEHRDD